MAKTKRGKPLRKQKGGRNRGTCPLCARTGVKLLTEIKSAGKTTAFCKACSSLATKQAAAVEAAAKAEAARNAPTAEAAADA